MKWKEKKKSKIKTKRKTMTFENFDTLTYFLFILFHYYIIIFCI